jgi:DNA-binding NtrC family response regulator
VSVILHGETGVGKDLIARCLHDFGSRQKGNYVAVNCAAIPDTMVESEFFGHEAGAFTSAVKSRPGKIEHASGGTLFLDEIDSMPPATQGKLLRVLQERSVERLGSNHTTTVDLRVVAASKIDLRKASEEARFRSDLYYRLSVVELAVPPLRERKEDIPLLFDYFAASSAAAHRRDLRPLSTATVNLLMAQDWPGNVRELRNAIERASIMSDGAEVDALDLSEEPAPKTLTATTVEIASNGNLMVPYTADFRDDRREFERRYIARCLEESGGNVTRAAAVLGMHRQSLQHKLRELGLARRYVSVGSQDKSET